MWNARKSNNLKQPKTKEGSHQINWESSSLKESLNNEVRNKLCSLESSC